MNVTVDYLPTLSIRVEDDPQIQKLISELNIIILRLNEILRALAVGVNTIEFNDNIMSDEISVEFSTAGTELTAAHSLTRAPSGIAAVRFAGQGGSVGFSSPSTSTNVYLKSDTDSLSGKITLI